MITRSLIREARLRAGLSQAQLGERLGKHPTEISRWERGVVLPSMETVRAVVRACGLELTYGLANADRSHHDAQLVTRSLALPPAERLRRGVDEFNTLDRIAKRAAEARRG